MSSSATETRQRMLNAILSRAATDRIFRSGLLTEPRQAISDAFGVAIPTHFRIRFIEREPDVDALVVLPDLRSEGDELSERELETANGGQGADFEWPDLSDLAW